MPNCGTKECLEGYVIAEEELEITMAKRHPKAKKPKGKKKEKKKETKS